MNFTRTLFATAALALAATGAFAQATIDHNKVLAGNVTPGDAAGYPLTITQPGHYRLTSNLVVPAGTAGIVISADNVTLDLNGFSVTGPRSCTQNATTRVVTCSAVATYPHGIDSNGVSGMTLRNGTVQGFGGYGVYFGSASRIENVTATQNGMGFAANAMHGAVLRGVMAILNEGDGITFGEGIVEGSIASGNGKGGINATRAVIVIDSVTSRNRTAGMSNVGASNTVSRQNGANQSSVASLPAGSNLDGSSAY